MQRKNDPTGLVVVGAGQNIAVTGQALGFVQIDKNLFSWSINTSTARMGDILVSTGIFDAWTPRSVPVLVIGIEKRVTRPSGATTA